MGAQSALWTNAWTWLISVSKTLLVVSVFVPLVVSVDAVFVFDEMLHLLEEIDREYRPFALLPRRAPQPAFQTEPPNRVLTT